MPAKKTVHNATGIDLSDIKDIRNRLQKLSVIDYKCNEYYHFLFINWTVIRGYALLPEPLKVGGNKRKYFVQQSQNEYQNHPLRGIWKEYLNEIAQIKKRKLQLIGMNYDRYINLWRMARRIIAHDRIQM